MYLLLSLFYWVLIVIVIILSPIIFPIVYFFTKEDKSSIKLKARPNATRTYTIIIRNSRVWSEYQKDKKYSLNWPNKKTYALYVYSQKKRLMYKGFFNSDKKGWKRTGKKDRDKQILYFEHKHPTIQFEFKNFYKMSEEEKTNYHLQSLRTHRN